MKKRKLKRQLETLRGQLEDLRSELRDVTERMPRRLNPDGSYTVKTRGIRSIDYFGADADLAVSYPPVPLPDLVTRDEMQKAIDASLRKQWAEDVRAKVVGDACAVPPSATEAKDKHHSTPWLPGGDVVEGGAKVFEGTYRRDYPIQPSVPSRPEDDLHPADVLDKHIFPQIQQQLERIALKDESLEAKTALIEEQRSYIAMAKARIAELERVNAAVIRCARHGAILEITPVTNIPETACDAIASCPECAKAWIQEPQAQAAAATAAPYDQHRIEYDEN